MRKNKKIKNLSKVVLSIVFSMLFFLITIIFSNLYLNMQTDGVLKDKIVLFKITTAILSAILTTTCIILAFKNQDVALKIMIFLYFCIATLLLIIYLLKITNFWDKVNDINDLRDYVSSFGAYAVIIFLLVQILQVVILPIPGVVAIGAGVALFGVKLGSLYSLLGILLGSFIAYYIGKYPGEKVVGWIVGKNNLQKTLKKVEGKDKIVLTFMFLFPFFPDDILCFVAGMSSMSQVYFAVMIVITRIIGVYTTAYSVNGSLIPYNTPWGIAIWVVLIVFTFVLAIILNKYGKAIENKIKEKIKKVK